MKASQRHRRHLSAYQKSFHAAMQARPPEKRAKLNAGQAVVGDEVIDFAGITRSAPTIAIPVVRAYATTVQHVMAKAVSMLPPDLRRRVDIGKSYADQLGRLTLMDAHGLEVWSHASQEAEELKAEPAVQAPPPAPQSDLIPVLKISDQLLDLVQASNKRIKKLEAFDQTAFGKAIGVSIREGLAPLRARIAELESKSVDPERFGESVAGVVNDSVTTLRERIAALESKSQGRYEH